MSLLRLNEIEEVDRVAGEVTVGAGATLALVQAAARTAGWEVGVDLGARDSATIGGMVATNAGGVNVVRHGTMRSQLLGFEAVRVDGTILRRLPGMPKDNTGYDLGGLLAGSEGTLAVITRVRLRLVLADAAPGGVRHRPRRCVCRGGRGLRAAPNAGLGRCPGAVHRCRPRADHPSHRRRGSVRRAHAGLPAGRGGLQRRRSDGRAPRGARGDRRGGRLGVGGDRSGRPASALAAARAAYGGHQRRGRAAQARRLGAVGALRRARRAGPAGGGGGGSGRPHDRVRARR